MNTHSPYLSYQLGVIHIIKESFYIEFNDIVKIGMLKQLITSCYGILYRMVRSESIAVLAELSFTNGFHYLFDTLLNKPVPNTWDP